MTTRLESDVMMPMGMTEKVRIVTDMSEKRMSWTLSSGEPPRLKMSSRMRRCMWMERKRMVAKLSSLRREGFWSCCNSRRRKNHVASKGSRTVTRCGKSNALFGMFILGIWMDTRFGGLTNIWIG